jgi:ATP-dependent DNA helicase RecG
MTDGAPQAGGAPGALGELLQALAPPLDYLASRDFRQVEHTRLPLAALGERLGRAREAAPESLRPALEELGRIVDALAASGADAGRLLRRAHDLLPALRAAVGAAAGGREAPPAPTGPAAPHAGPWAGYAPTAGDVAPALALLGRPAEVVRGVGPKRAGELARFELETVEDVLYHLPFRYEDRRALRPLRTLQPGDEATAVAEVSHVREARNRGGRPVLEAVVRDADGMLTLVWFHQIQWFKRRLAIGQRLVVHGRVEGGLAGGPRRIIHPEIETLGAGDEAEPPERIVPVYEKPTEMHVGAMRRIVHAAVAEFADRVPSALPPEVAARHRVVDVARALRHVHTPPPEADVGALQGLRSLAHRSLVFDELFFLQLGLELRRSATAEEAGTPFPASTRLVPALRARLPFRPTGAQERAAAEIAADQARPHPMRRLLQGDVGSGKTLVALMGALAVAESGWQTALMAPTELLAEQHFETIRPLAEPLGVEARLLTGAVKGRARKAALAAIAEGRTAVAVGTQALIQEGVEFARLGLAIVDEQHRFGVLQRAALQKQHGGLDMLVMSATPIPRTLAMTLYGDLAVSTLDELPPGRTPIATRVVRESRRAEVAKTIRAEVAAGHQAYVVYPLVDESEKTALKAATKMVHELAAGPLAGLRLDLVHGRMKAEEKDAVMRRFKAREFDVLVSTTVIEVGIDVANATVIVIEHAERFGLAQLHQLRGRVGRGRAPGHCFLLAPDWMGQDAWQRLATLERSTDGFVIAEADLQLRGPGDFLGTRQAGLPDFRVANLLRDTALLKVARDEALAWLARDPLLDRPESSAIRAVLRHRWKGRLGLARVG